MEKGVLNYDVLESYKRHPRILEVRAILLFDLLEMEFGYTGFMDLLNGLCIGFKRNLDILNILVNKRNNVKSLSKTNRLRWKQEVLFMGMCYGETPYKIAKSYLNIHPSNIYMYPDKYGPEEFVTNEWLRKLDDEIKFVGDKYYIDEVSSFIEMMDSLANALLKWKIIKD